MKHECGLSDMLNLIIIQRDITGNEIHHIIVRPMLVCVQCMREVNTRIKKPKVCAELKLSLNLYRGPVPSWLAGEILHHILVRILRQSL